MIYINIHIYMCIVCVYMYIYIEVNVYVLYICIYTHTHTHTRVLRACFCRQKEWPVHSAVRCQKECSSRVSSQTDHFILLWDALRSPLQKSPMKRLYSAKQPYKRDDIEQKRLILWRSLLIVAIPDDWRLTTCLCFEMPSGLWFMHLFEWGKQREGERMWARESMSHAHMNESCHVWMSNVTFEWVMSQMNGSCHIWMGHVTYEWVMSHINAWECEWCTHEWVRHKLARTEARMSPDEWHRSRVDESRQV